MDDRTLHQLIVETAKKLWEEAGKPDGDDQTHWFEAVRQVSRMTTLPAVTSSSNFDKATMSDGAVNMDERPTPTG